MALYKNYEYRIAKKIRKGAIVTQEEVDCMDSMLSTGLATLGFGDRKNAETGELETYQTAKLTPMGYRFWKRDWISRQNWFVRRLYYDILWPIEDLVQYDPAFLATIIFLIVALVTAALLSGG